MPASQPAAIRRSKQLKGVSQQRKERADRRRRERARRGRSEPTEGGASEPEREGASRQKEARASQQRKERADGCGRASTNIVATQVVCAERNNRLL
jgi:hypothetical protein